MSKRPLQVVTAGLGLIPVVYRLPCVIPSRARDFARQWLELGEQDPSDTAGIYASSARWKSLAAPQELARRTAGPRRYG
jgi:hypothetical protein